MPTLDDRIREVLKDIYSYGTLEIVEAEPLINEILEAGFRANPALLERVEELHREEDRQVVELEPVELRRAITGLSEALDRPAPDDLESMPVGEMRKLFAELLPLVRQKHEHTMRVTERVTEAHGPLLILQSTFTIVTPEAFLERAKELWREKLRGPADDHLDVREVKGLTHEQIHPEIHQQHVQPLLEKNGEE